MCSTDQVATKDWFWDVCVCVCVCVVTHLLFKDAGEVSTVCCFDEVDHVTQTPFEGVLLQPQHIVLSVARLRDMARHHTLRHMFIRVQFLTTQQKRHQLGFKIINIDNYLPLNEVQSLYTLSYWS